MPPKIINTFGGANFDAFGRLRSSGSTALFESNLRYDLQPLLWGQSITGSAAVSHLSAEAAASLSVAANADVAVRQSFQYALYRPSKSQYIALTFNMNGVGTNVTKRVGYFSTTNGIFLEQAGSTVNIVLRSTVSGLTVDNAVPQASWNVDKFNGNGPSGITLNLLKAQILIIDLQWLGAGRVRVGFDINGTLFYAHEFQHANLIDTVYMQQATLPCRYEISATGVPSGDTTLKQICNMVASEDGWELDKGVLRSAGNGITSINALTRRPICSIRPKTTFNGIVNRALISPEGVSLIASGFSGYWELVYNGSLTNASFTDVATNSFCQKDVAATAISGGEVIAAGYVLAGSGSTKGGTTSPIVSRLPLTLDINGANPTPLTLVVTSLSGSTACTVSGAIDWREVC